MPKSKNRSNHKQKIEHQRMLDKHKAEKTRKEQEAQFKAFEEMVKKHQESKKVRQAEFIKSLALNTEQTDSEAMLTAMSGKAVIAVEE